MESNKTANKLLEIISQGVEDKVFPGCVVGFVSKKERYVLPVGSYTYDHESSPLEKNSIFDVASVTKTIPTALVALMLIADRKISLNDPVKKYLPLFKGRWKDDVKIFHLLTQTVNYGFSLSSLKHKTPEEIIDVIDSCGLKTPPGKNYLYTNSSSIILGRIIEVVAGESLDKFAHKKLFQPLKMKDTSFSPKKIDYPRIVPTEVDPWRKITVKGIVHDESAYVLSRNNFVGSAGLFSTAPDLLNVLEMIVQDGKFEGKQILSKKIIREMSKNQLKEIGEFSGLGWELNNAYIENQQRGNLISKTGFTGCFIACDPKRKTGIVMLSNYHFPHRKKDFTSLNSVRRQIIDTVLSVSASF